MKTKTKFTIIIAVIFIAVMYFYHDTMTFLEIAGAFLTNGLLITTIWQWFSKEELKVKNRYLQKRVNDYSIKLNNLQQDYYRLAEEHLDKQNQKKTNETPSQPPADRSDS